MAAGAQQAGQALEACEGDQRAQGSRSYSTAAAARLPWQRPPHCISLPAVLQGKSLT